MMKKSMNLLKLKKIGNAGLTLETVGFFINLIEAYKENKKTEIEIENIRAKRDEVLKEIELKYDFYNKVFCEIFKERKVVIDKYFEIIDMGIAKNDKELINTGLSSLSKIVCSSPFADLNSLSKMIENDEIIEI